MRSVTRRMLSSSSELVLFVRSLGVFVDRDDADVELLRDNDPCIELSKVILRALRSSESSAIFYDYERS